MKDLYQRQIESILLSSETLVVKKSQIVTNLAQK